ncbi:hypothetical protein A0256_23680 [Mucilaginibacter sp. PAMC 26640]|nr:hypothetical protein A0256_23680 [Mucilaginibacter sp. PAMC 26640]
MLYISHDLDKEMNTNTLAQDRFKPITRIHKSHSIRVYKPNRVITAINIGTHASKLLRQRVNTCPTGELPDHRTLHHNRTGLFNPINLLVVKLLMLLK